MDSTCNCKSYFDVKTLRYISPARVGCGMLRMATLIPGCYELLVGPLGCGRHGALTSFVQGNNEKVFFLCIDESDIVSGSYEELIFEACNEIFEVLEERGEELKVLIIVTTCIDDLLGTDREKLEEELENRYQDLNVVFAPMNPIALDTGKPTMNVMFEKIYSILNKSEEKDEGVNIIGNIRKIEDDNELIDVLKSMGVSEVRQILNCENLEDFQNMSKSKWNIVVSTKGDVVSESMRAKLGIPYIEMLDAYIPKNISKQYRKLGEVLGKEVKLDLDSCEKKIEDQALDLKKTIGNCPIVIDEQGIKFPYEFGVFLLDRGFNLKIIYGTDPKPKEVDYYEKIKKHYPQVKLELIFDPKGVLKIDKMEECISIGLQSGYLTSSIHNVGLSGEDGIYGFYGLSYILSSIKNAFLNRTDLKENMDKKARLIR